MGRPDGACVPDFTMEVKAHTHERNWQFYEKNAGHLFPVEHTKKAIKEIDEMCRILEMEGVKVRRPEKIVHQQPFQTPDFHSPSGLYAAMPRLILN